MEGLEDDLRTLIVAYVRGICLYATTNAILGNKDPVSLRRCEGASRQLPCNSCLPFWNNPSPQMPQAMLIAPAPSTTKVSILAARKPYPKHLQENAALWLNDVTGKSALI